MSQNDLSWTTESETVELDCRIFSVNSVQRKAEGNRSGQFTVIDSPDWVTVLPIIKNSQGDNCFIIVEQFRHGFAALSKEFPAGMIDSGETPLQAAARELEEETGYQAGKMTQIGVINPNPAFMNNHSYTYLAEILTPTGKTNLDEHEMIEVELVSEAEVARSMGLGLYNSAITVQAWFWYLRYQEKITL